MTDDERLSAFLETHVPLRTGADRVNERFMRLRAAVQERGQWISGDDRVGPGTAAWLLGVTEATLRNWRTAGKGPLYFHIGGAGHRVSYDLRKLAEFIEELQCDW